MAITTAFLVITKQHTHVTSRSHAQLSTYITEKLAVPLQIKYELLCAIVPQAIHTIY